MGWPKQTERWKHRGSLSAFNDDSHQGRELESCRLLRSLRASPASLLPEPDYNRPSTVSPLPTTIPEFTIAKPPLQNHNVEMSFDSKRSQAESFRDAERTERCATSSSKKSMRLKKTIPKKRIRYNESSMNRRVARKLAKCYQNFAKEYNEFKLLDQIFSRYRSNRR